MMRPAFSSTQQAAAFALLLLSLLAAPWLAGKSLLPSREQAYASEGWSWGPYPWIERQIFEETNNIDIVFMGSSHIAWGIDTPYVQKTLDAQLGRKSVVRSICWFGGGFDLLYFATRDLLEHRRVKTLVFYDESTAISINRSAPHWFRFGEDSGMLAALPFRTKAVFYFAAVVGMPRNLVELITPNLPAGTNDGGNEFFAQSYHSPNAENRLGAVTERAGFNATTLGDEVPFVPFTPQTGATPADACIYSAAPPSRFIFSNRPIAAWQVYFAKQFGLLAKSHSVNLVLLHLPISSERESTVIEEPLYWPDFLQTPVAMLGIPANRLFNGLTGPQTRLLYADANHFNQNGQTYFTSLITPALLQIYENQPGH